MERWIRQRKLTRAASIGGSCIYPRKRTVQDPWQLEWSWTLAVANELEGICGIKGRCAVGDKAALVMEIDWAWNLEGDQRNILRSQRQLTHKGRNLAIGPKGGRKTEENGPRVSLAWASRMNGISPLATASRPLEGAVLRVLHSMHKPWHTHNSAGQRRNTVWGILRWNSGVDKNSAQVLDSEWPISWMPENSRRYE